MSKYDIVLKGGMLIDPVNKRTGIMDIGIRKGTIDAVKGWIDASDAEECFDLQGQYVMPGIVDMHMHSSSKLGGIYAHKMLAKAGVTTALDMAGPVDSVLEYGRDYGTGLTIAVLDALDKEYNLSGNDPGYHELELALEYGLKHGAIGLKLMGGNYPLTPEASKLAIQVANDHRAYVAFHAATTNTGSQIEGFHEAVALTGDNHLHMAHINSYCRGMIRPCEQETMEVLDALKKHPNIRSEAYLASINGNTAKCTDGKPIPVICNCLRMQHYEETEAGLEQAILDGWAQINVLEGGTVELRTGKKAVEYWKQHQTNTGICFAVNPNLPRYWLATEKRSNGEFVVDAISTDGGGIPRNYILKYGLSLVKLQALSLEDFVMKASVNPGRIIGFTNKGHLGEGADADITVFNYQSQEPYMSIGSGKIIMYRGLVCGRGCNIATSTTGADHVRSFCLNPVVIDVSKGAFYNH